MLVVGAIIRNKKGEFLLQQRDGNAPSFKYCWTLFGGIVEEGETPREAILRELSEEIALLSMDIESISQKTTYYQENGTKQIIFEVLIDVPIDRMRLSEGHSMEYAQPDKLFNRRFAFNIENVLKTYLHM